MYAICVRINNNIYKDYFTFQQMASSYKVEILPSPACVLGEGPHWDIERQSLYFVDIYGGKNGSLHRYDYAENKIYSASIGIYIKKSKIKLNLFYFIFLFRSRAYCIVHHTR